MGSLKANQIVPILLLIAAGFGFYSFREHRELERQQEVIRAKDREEAELKERLNALETEKKAVETNEMRLAGEQKAAIAKEAADKLAAEQQRVQLAQQTSEMTATLNQEKKRLEDLKKQREALRAKLLSGNSGQIESRIRQNGEDVRSYEERVKNYRASVLQQQGTQKQQLAQVRLNYETEMSRVRQAMADQDVAIKATQNAQTEWRGRRTDYDRPAKLKELADQLNAQRATLATLKNQMTALKNAEQLDTRYIQNQINASGDLAKRAGQDEPAANAARTETSNLKFQKAQLDQQAVATSNEVRSLDEQIRTQESRVRDLEAAIAKSK